jgi:hypothetical protein
MRVAVCRCEGSLLNLLIMASRKRARIGIAHGSHACDIKNVITNLSMWQVEEE